MVPAAGDENLQVMRGVLGLGPSDFELARALRLAKNDITLAFNILYDTMGYKDNEVNIKRTTAGSGARVSTANNHQPAQGASLIDKHNPPQLSLFAEVSCNERASKESSARFTNTHMSNAQTIEPHATSSLLSCMDPIDLETQSHDRRIPSVIVIDDEENDESHPGFLLVGKTEVMGYSTSKGPKLKAGDSVSFRFPRTSHTRAVQGWAYNGRATAAAQQIVRFYSQATGEV